MGPEQQEQEQEIPSVEASEMKVEAIAARTHVLFGKPSRLQLMVRITVGADESPKAMRPPLCLACVMDCSGSMCGEKLRFAKRAVLKLVKHLTPQDTLHFVTYSNIARVVFEAGDLTEAGKERLRQQIEAVKEGGMTNLAEGLSTAAALLRNPSNVGATKDATVSQLGQMRRIFLFSDGRINAGILDPRRIKTIVADWASAGIVTCSFGIGSDFDEPLMRGIALAGQGRYQFLGEAQDIPKHVSKSVHDLIDIYASEATLDLRGTNNTTVSRVYGGKPASTPGLLRLGDVHSDNVRVVLAELDICPPESDEPSISFTAAEWSLTCQRQGSPVSISGQVQIQCTQDKDMLQKEEDEPAVLFAFALRRATDLERTVAEHVSSRNRYKARDVKAQQIALLESSLEAAELHGGSTGEFSSEVELLSVVLDRAGQVAARLENEQEDQELVARQCWQDRDDFSCASLCDLRDRCDSSDGSRSFDLECDHHNLGPDTKCDFDSFPMQQSRTTWDPSACMGLSTPVPPAQPPPSTKGIFLRS